MASKRKEATPKNKAHVDYKPSKAVPLMAGESNDITAHNCAELVTSPQLAAMRVIRSAERTTGINDLIDVPALMDELRWQGDAVNKGNLAQAEAMLMNQATALQSLFARLAERGMGNDQIPGFEANMRMALRAQSQCRATLETLAAIKNPPIVYAKQANVTTGPQQINNGVEVTSRAREIETEQTQQSGGTHELLPDTRTSGDASRVNPALETLGEIDRTKVPRG